MTETHTEWIESKLRGTTKDTFVRKILVSFTLLLVASAPSNETWALPAPAKALGQKPLPTPVPSKVLIFPKDFSLGTIRARDKNSRSPEDWKLLGKKSQAQGSVRVPLDMDLRLDVDPKGAKHLEVLIDGFKNTDLFMLNLGRLSVTDADMKYVGRISGLHILNLRGTPITDKGVAHLSFLTRLETLYLDNTKITDNGLDYLKGMTNLAHLDLAQNTGSEPPRITDAGAEKIGAMKTLFYLNLEGSAVTDNGISKLYGLSHLYSLNLSKSKVTDAGLASLQSLSTLRDLFLNDTAVTDTGLAQLRGMQMLQNISLNNSKVTEKGLDPLNAFGGLSSLEFRSTDPISSAGMNSLKSMRVLRKLTINKGQLTDDLLKDLKTARPELQIFEIDQQAAPKQSEPKEDNSEAKPK